MLKSFRIGEKLIGKGKIFIIAEIGSNHNQNMDIAKKLIDVAVEAGADAVKFQSIKYDKLYIQKENNEMEKLFEKIQLKENWHKKLFDYCRTKQILFFSAPTYLEAVNSLEKVNVKLYKIASPQAATFPQLIEKIAKLRKPIIMSTGYCTLEEIDRAVKIVKKMGNDKLALLHCISEYPTNPESANLKFIQKLKDTYNIPVGFSDHTLGWGISVAAIAMQADIIEKHITLSRNQKGPDHFFSLEPDEFKTMVKNIRIIEKATGNGIKLRISLNETKMLNKIRMKAVAKYDISKEKIINKEKDIIFRRNVNGIDAWEIYKAGNLITKGNIKKNMPLTYKCVNINLKRG